MRDLERWVLLQLIDQHWREHLYNMDYLREGIHLRALGQKDPLSEYRLEGHGMFDEMMDIVKSEFVRYMFHIQVDAGSRGGGAARRRGGLQLPERPDPGLRRRRGRRGGPPRRGGEAEVETARRPVAVVEQRVLSDDEKVGRNDPCPCGSGKKYKRCHGA